MSIDVVTLCRELIRIPSESGREGAVAEFVAQAMRDLGFDTVTVDKFGSVIGERRGAGDGPATLFDAHMDTVAPASPGQWTHDPLAGDLSDGKVWGLGAADVKGGLAAVLCGIAGVPAESLLGRVIVSASVAEENLTGVALGHVLDSLLSRSHSQTFEVSETSKVSPHSIDVSVIVEPANLSVGIAQKGGADIVLRTRGRSAHTSRPELGDNAVYKMMEAVARLRSLDQPVDAELGPGVLELAESISEPIPGTGHVPDGCPVSWPP